MPIGRPFTVPGARPAPKKEPSGASTAEPRPSQAIRRRSVLSKDWLTDGRFSSIRCTMPDPVREASAANPPAGTLTVPLITWLPLFGLGSLPALFHWATVEAIG